MKKLSAELMELKWSQLDDFAQRIHEISVDDNGDQNDVRYISQCLIDWANEVLSS